MTMRKGKDKLKDYSQTGPQPSAAVGSDIRQRDLRIDSLRGLLLIVMVIDHFKSYIANVTYQTFGYVSVAEPFFFLSAYVFAGVYARQAENLNYLFKVGVRRAFLLYRYHIALVLVLPLLAFAFSLSKESWQILVGSPFYRYPLSTIFQELFFIHQPPLMDILPMYFVFILLSPLILAAFHRNQCAPVFAVSFVLWFWGQHVTPLEWLAGLFPGSRAGYFNWIAWQVIWVGGMYLGFMHYRGKSFSLLRNRVFIGFVFVLATILFLSRHEWINLGFNAEFAAWRPDVGWLRLLNFGMIVTLVGYLLSYIPQNKGIPWVSFIGRYSLQVFSYHVFLLFLLAPISYALLKSGQQHTYALLSVGAVLSLSIPALIKNRMELRKQATLISKIPE